MARRKSASGVASFSSRITSAVLAAGRRRRGKVKRKKSGARKRRLFSAEQIAALRARAAGIVSPAATATWSKAPTGDAAALRLAALKGISRAVGGASIVKLNPRRKHMRKRHSRRARARRYGNPVILSNRAGRRRRHMRNPGLVRLFNPGLGAIKALPGRAIGAVKNVASLDNAKKAGAVVLTILAAWGAPAKLAPQYDAGLPGLGLTALAGAVGSALLGVVAPSLAPMAVVGAGVATLLKGLMIYGRSWVMGGGFSGMGDFLTLGQIPASMIQGGRGMGDFLTTTQPVTAIGPARSTAMGGGENFSDFS